MHVLVSLTIRLTHILSRIGLTLLVVYAVMTTVDGLSRGLFNAPIDTVRDVGGLIAAVAVSFCIPQCFAERHNITIVLAGPLLSPRTNQGLDAFASLVVATILGLMARQFWIYANSLAVAGDTTAMLQIQLAPFWYGVAFNITLAFLAQVFVVTVPTMFGVFSHKKPAPTAPAH